MRKCYQLQHLRKPATFQSCITGDRSWTRRTMCMVIQCFSESCLPGNVRSSGTNSIIVCSAAVVVTSDDDAMSQQQHRYTDNHLTTNGNAHHHKLLFQSFSMFPNISVALTWFNLIVWCAINNTTLIALLVWHWYLAQICQNSYACFDEAVRRR